MSYSHEVDMSEMDVYDTTVNDSFSNDESSNDFNPSLQVVASKPSTNTYAQKSSSATAILKTRSKSTTLKRVSSSASCSFVGDESPSPSKMLNNDMSTIDCNEWNQERENISQDEDDEDDAMEYDAEDQTDNPDNSVLSSSYKTHPIPKAKEVSKCDYFNESSLISYDLQNANDSSSFSSSFQISNNSNVSFSNPSTSQSSTKPAFTRHVRHRITKSKHKQSKKIIRPSKNLFTENHQLKLSNDVAENESAMFRKPRYPLRSRARLEKVKCRLRESVVGAKTLEILPVEIYYRIFQYLPIQDLFRIQRVNKRFKEAVDNHLLMVKRINFSCGLPFAFLPDCLNDSVLKRIMLKTPEVTHILGFYPRKIEDVPGINNSLTYSGIMSALRQCTKLRSVEIMDLELMSRIVHALNRVKFHGMFRNRPYSWEDEYANPFVTKGSTNGPTSSSCNSNSLQFYENTNNIADNNIDLRQSSTKYGICNKLTALKSLCNIVSMQQSRDLHMNFINYTWLGSLEQMSYVPIGHGLPLFQPINQSPVVNLVSPIPPSHEKLIIPTTINNLTKLDLVSVCIQHLPRLENIKYLHLKWVRFSSPDPFTNFQAPKIQSFVMNNCIGPIRGMRYVRIFTALARSPQLNRLELVSTRIVEGLFENFFLDTDQGHRCFRNLQRLVLSSNKEFGEVDVAALLLSSHSSLNHLALSVSHSRNSLMLSLANAKVTMQKLESVILGYQDPFQSMLTGVEIHNLGLHDSPDHSLPICKITDRGVAALMKIAPKLISLHLRHAIYVEDPMMWSPKKWPYPIGNKPINPFENNSENDDQLPATFPLKSLTLENCPGIRPEIISFILNHPATAFPQLEMLVLRDLFPPLPKCDVPQVEIDSAAFIDSLSNNRPHNIHFHSSHGLNIRGKLSNFQINTHNMTINQIIDGLCDRNCPIFPIRPPGSMHTNDSFNLSSSSSPNSNMNVGDVMDNTNPNNNRFSRIFIPNISTSDIRIPNTDSGMFGMSTIGLASYNAAGAQVLGAQHTNLGASIRQNEFLRPPMIVNAMKSISMIHRLENLGIGNLVLAQDSQLKTSDTDHCENFNSTKSNEVCRFVGTSKRKRSRSNEKSASSYINHGILFHKSLLPKPKSLKTKKETIQNDKSVKKRRISEQSWIGSSQNIEENVLCDFQSSSTQTCVCGHIDWLDAVWQRDVFQTTDEQSYQKNTLTRYQSNSSHKHSTSKPISKTSVINITEYGCKLCSCPVDNFDNPSMISLPQSEPNVKHNPREWEAQDVSLDTTSLRLYFKPRLYKIELKQNSFAHLTTLHMEKVGITHLVLISCHRLKSITLENCSELQAIVISSGTAPPADSMPNLRRIRIMRCPKFAIYNLLYHVTQFYPQHDDNLYITFRPFGEYNPLVEKALWLNSDSQHVMVSHEYRQASSERNLEELCSSFDQLFREMLNFSESLIRRDILTVSDFSRVNNFTNGSFLRSEHGTDWDLLTDIPWISEVCCSMLPSDLTRTQQADQLYELLSEIQSHISHMKLRRRGIHFHVQFRDVHKPSMNDGTSLINEIIPDDPGFSYLPFPYTDLYLQSTHPKIDSNANFCQPDLSDVYPELNQDLCEPVDIFSNFHLSSSSPSLQQDVNCLPLHLRNLLNCTNDDSNVSFGPDINERIPIPQQFSSDKLFNKSSCNTTSAITVTGSGSTVMNTATSSSATPSHNTQRHQSSRSSDNNDGNRIQSSQAEFMVQKLAKFKSNLNALKKPSEHSSLNDMTDLAHSTRSKTAEMMLQLETRSSASNNNSNGNIQHNRHSKH